MPSRLYIRGDRKLTPTAEERVDSAELVIHLLGGFKVFVGDRGIDATAWRLRKASGLVKLLALASGHRLHREQVLDQLWPERPPDAAANNLRVTLHAARRLLEAPPLVPEVFLLRDDWLTFAPGLPVWVDVDAFESAARGCSDDPAAFHSALALYRGDLLPDDRYDDWLIERRQSLRDTRMSLLLRLARLHEQRGEVDFAIESLEHVLSIDPAYEEAHIGLMRLHSQGGRRREALRQYVRLRDALKQELDVDPDPESERLYEDILAHRTTEVASSQPIQHSAPQLPPPANRATVPDRQEHRTNLPVQLTSFVGRGREITQVKQALNEHRLVTLTGPGGSGKTRLALQVASGLADEFPDGVRLVELAGLPDAALVPRAVASALAIRDMPENAALDSLVDGLDGQRLLLLLDNCEHLIDSSGALIDALLRACPLLRVLTTSREALGLPGEMVIAAPPLTMPNPRRLPPLDQIASAEAVQLFVERARLLQPGLAVTEGNAAAIVQICRRLEGLPLAIELAAARVRALSVQQIAARLDDSLQLLTGGGRTRPVRQQTLQASLDWSHGLLHPAEQAVLRRLAVFANGCTLEAAEAVCAGAGVSREMVLDLLFQLVDKSLLVVEEPAGEIRYRLLEPIRQYAALRLEESQETAEAQGRHLSWSVTLGEQSEAALRGATQHEWLDRMEREHDNLRLALGWSMSTAGDAGQGLRLAWSLWRFWDARGYQAEGRHWLTGLLALPATAGRTTLRAKGLFGAGRMAIQQGDYPAASVLTGESLAIARERKDEQAAAAALNQLGHAFRRLGRYVEARLLYEEGLAIRRMLGDPRDISLSLGGLGRIVLAQGDHEAACSLFEECLAIRREIGDRQGIAIGLMFLGTVASSRGDHIQAVALFDESLFLLRELGDKHRSAEVLDCLALARLGLADLDAAEMYAAESLALNREQMDEMGAAESLEILGGVAFRRGDHARAEALLAESLSLLHGLKIHEGVHGCLEAIAAVLALRDEPERGARILGAATASRDAIGAPLPPAGRPDYEQALETVRATLGETAFARSWDEGRAKTLNQAVDDALAAAIRL